MVITIDGPAASGKGTAARGLAARLGFDYLDTGAMYRAVAYAVQQRGLPCTDAAAVEALLPQLHLEVVPPRLLIDGRDVTEQLRTPQVAQGSSQVAVLPAVRAFLVDLQRRFAQ
ncbi:MAG: (d)CMP kinase, partial [Gemmataceae bacterium]|nr:(d)CMP kinase [Gemmataceae bacterium]